MSSMFFGCSSLKKLKISNFNTNKVKDFSHMFNKCSILTALDISNFKLEGKNIEKMFVGIPDDLEINIKNQNPNIKIEAFI